MNDLNNGIAHLDENSIQRILENMKFDIKIMVVLICSSNFIRMQNLLFGVFCFLNQIH